MTSRRRGLARRWAVRVLRAGSFALAAVSPGTRRAHRRRRAAAGGPRPARGRRRGRLRRDPGDRTAARPARARRPGWCSPSCGLHTWFSLTGGHGCDVGGLVLTATTTPGRRDCAPGAVASGAVAQRRCADAARPGRWPCRSRTCSPCCSPRCCWPTARRCCGGSPTWPAHRLLAPGRAAARGRPSGPRAGRGRARCPGGCSATRPARPDARGAGPPGARRAAEPCPSAARSRAPASRHPAPRCRRAARRPSHRRPHAHSHPCATGAPAVADGAPLPWPARRADRGGPRRRTRRAGQRARPAERTTPAPARRSAAPTSVTLTFGEDVLAAGNGNRIVVTGADGACPARSSVDGAVVAHDVRATAAARPLPGGLAGRLGRRAPGVRDVPVHRRWLRAAASATPRHAHGNGTATASASSLGDRHPGSVVTDERARRHEDAGRWPGQGPAAGADRGRSTQRRHDRAGQASAAGGRA